MRSVRAEILVTFYNAGGWQQKSWSRQNSVWTTCDNVETFTAALDEALASVLATSTPWTSISVRVERYTRSTVTQCIVLNGTNIDIHKAELSRMRQVLIDNSVIKPQEKRNVIEKYHDNYALPPAQSPNDAHRRNSVQDWDYPFWR